MKTAFVYLSILTIALAAGCGGTRTLPISEGGSPVASGAASAAHKHRLGKARIRIRIPRKRHGRHGRYISPSTQSISIATTGQKTVVANLTRASSNCTTVAGTGLVCTINVTAEVGSHQFSFVTYDGLNATGNALSANTLMLDVLDKGTTPLNVTLGGIAASIAFSASTVPQVLGSQLTGYTMYGNLPQNFTVIPVDADGNDIIGSGAPSISITPPPPAQHISVTAPSVSPNVWQLTSTYAATNPLTPLDDTVTAVSTPIPGSGGTTISSIVSFTLYQPWVYVTDTSSGTPIDVFDERGNPITTTATQPWYDIPSPTGITYDPHNQQLYIAGEGGNIVYVNDVEGNDIYPSGTPWQNLGSPMSALYVPSNNFIYVGNAGSGNGPAGITVYDENGAQQVPSGGFSSPSPGSANGLAFDPTNGFIYAAGGGLSVPAVVTYDVNGSGQTLGASAFSSLVEALGIGYDSNDGFLYVASYNPLGVFAFDGLGNAQTTTGTFSGLTFPTGAFYDPYDGLLYVADGGSPSPPVASTVHVYDEQGNTQPITFNATFSTAYGVTVVP